jgi:Bacterial DNA-binding protein
VSKAQAKSIVDDITKNILDAAASGAAVSLPGSGKFKVKATPEREGRNPAKWREYQDRCVKEPHLFVRQIGQGPPEPLSRTTTLPNLGNPHRRIRGQNRVAGRGQVGISLIELAALSANLLS